MTSKDEGSSSPERKAIAAARAAASEVISEHMQQVMLQGYLPLLQQQESREAHRFAPMIDWAVRSMGDVPLLDSISISRITIKRWISGEATPGPMAREAVFNTIEQLARNRLK